MTAPPEAKGPESAEAQEFVMAVLDGPRHGRDLEAVSADIDQRLSRLVRSAQVAAHEADAKAGCYFCGLPDLFNPAALQAVRKGGKRWRHTASDAPEEAYLCERPEIWDALSKLRESEKAE